MPFQFMSHPQFKLCFQRIMWLKTSVYSSRRSYPSEKRNHGFKLFKYSLWFCTVKSHVALMLHKLKGKWIKMQKSNLVESNRKTKSWPSRSHWWDLTKYVKEVTDLHYYICNAAAQKKTEWHILILTLGTVLVTSFLYLILVSTEIWACDNHKWAELHSNCPSYILIRIVCFILQCADFFFFLNPPSVVHLLFLAKAGTPWWSPDSARPLKVVLQYGTEYQHQTFPSTFHHFRDQIYI